MAISETTIAAIFIVLLGIFLYVKRSKLDIQKWLFPIMYMILYRAKWGLKAMDDGAKRFPRTVKWLSYVGVYVCFAGMAVTIFYLFYTLWEIFKGSTQAAVAIAQPFVETPIGSPFFYIPFSYFIITIFIIAVVHEFSHGIVARRFGMKVKSSGFAFFSFLIPILPAAFVEPDEKQVQKAKPMHQLAMFAAGPFSNLLLTVLFLGILIGSQSALGGVTDHNVVIINYTNENNVTMPAELAGIGIGEKIVSIDSTEITDVKSFITFMETSYPGQNITFTTNVTSYNLQLASSPDNKTGYLGVFVASEYQYKPDFEEKYGWAIAPITWLLGLFFLLFVFNFGVALINLAPIGPLDGGRMILTLLKLKFSEKKALMIWGKISSLMLLVLLADIFLPFILKMFI
ncbi:site-2 protease family protein [Candidatus Woesearchaeota archaeon]|nr:site-2 protease family protein [Candidatus Woesearchaeota archaeon]